MTLFDRMKSSAMSVSVFFNDTLQGNLRSWLLNKECYDHFSVIYAEGDKTAIFLNSPEPTNVEERAVSSCVLLYFMNFGVNSWTLYLDSVAIRYISQGKVDSCDILIFYEMLDISALGKSSCLVY